MHAQGQQAQIEGGWNELKGKVKESWGELSDDELRQFEGDAQQFIGFLQRKTGQAQEQVEKKLAELDARFRPLVGQATAAAQEYLQSGAEAATDAAAYVRDSVAATHAQAEQAVRRRPIESVAVAFGTGIIAGAVVGLLLRQR